MSETDFRRLWLVEFERDILKRREQLQRALDALTKQDSNYAEGHRVMLRVYESALLNVQQELAKL